ncbi:uncharacterized protein LOC108675876 [Hyalella azteca]|uniref:Uncharacterized protein LOC108675876 n=1 Tax=Hyalella azteca TaxID=294128 RepID=A0A8B7P080_HYAAZ|nr:uncharacterized protein LOC108675876 [Hyalella azteca]
MAVSGHDRLGWERRSSEFLMEKIHTLNPLFRDEGLPAHPDLPRLRDPASRNELQNSSIGASTNVHDMKRVRNDGYPSEENKAAKDVIRTPDSPPTDHNSVRSSGYGSKENDSASDISEHSGEESDNESNNDVIDNITNNRGHRKRKKKIDNENHLLSTKTGVKSGVLEQSGVNGSEFLSAENLFINSIKLEENSTLLPTVSQLRRSFEDIATKNNAKLCDSVNNLPLDYHRNPKYVESIQVGVRRAKSLEIVKEDETLTNSEHHAKAAIPSPIWPRVSHITETLERQASRISSRRLADAERPRRSSSLDIRPKGQVLRFNPLVSVVTQDSRYVTAISVSPRRSNQTTTFNIASTNEQITYFNEELESNKNLDDFAPGDDRLTRYFNSGLSNRGYLGSTEYPIMSLQPDSLVTEDTLKMMTYPEYTGNSGALSSPILPSNEKHNDLSQVMYTRGLYATLNRNALLQNNNLMNAPFKTRRDKRSRTHSHRTSQDGSNTRVKKKGMDTVRNLWEKSGLKLNGRKLLVNIESEADENQEIAEQNHSINEWYEYGSSERDSSHYEYVSDVDALDDEEFIPSLSRRRNPSNDDRSLSSKSVSSRNRPMITPNFENITHLIESKQSSSQASSRKSIENFAMDNLAFTYDNGDRSNPYHITYRASNHVQGQSRTEIYNKIKVHKSMSGKSSILKNTDSIIGPMYHSGNDESGKTDQLVDRNENEYSELKEIVIDANSLARHIVPQGNIYSTRESHETTKEGSLSKTSTSAWITSSFGARGSLQKTGQGISKPRDPHPNDRVSEAITQIKPDKNLGPANMSSSLHPVPALEISRETSTIDSSGGSASAPSVYNVSDQPAENGMTTQPNHTAVNIDTVDDHLNEGLFWNIVRFLQTRRDSGNITQNQASNETQKPAAEKRYEDYKKSAKNNYARKLSPHPNSGAQNCRVGGALCADFTLDGAAAREQHRRSRAAKRRKKLCRTISALLALLVFVAVVVAVSWYITGGRRVFGPM